MVIRSCKCATQRGLHAEEREEVRGDGAALYLERLPGFGESHGVSINGGRHGGQHLEGLRAHLPISKLWTRQFCDVARIFRIALPCNGQAVLLREPQSFQQHSVHEAEEGGPHSPSERQAQKREERKPRMPTQVTE